MDKWGEVDEVKKYLGELIERYPVLKSSETDIFCSYQILESCFYTGGKLLIAGNGGSAADSEHMVGELMKGFSHVRKLDKELADSLRKIDAGKGEKLADKLQKALPAIALNSHTSFNTAFANDVDGQLGFAQQVIGYGGNQDVLFAISTSGNSDNIVYAAIAAKAKGMKIIGLTGNKGGELAKYADIVIRVNEEETYKVQELHLPVYHCLCNMLETRFFAVF